MIERKIITGRKDEDIELLIKRANSAGYFKNESRLVNNALRALLTPLFGNKRIRNLQIKMGIK